MTVFRLFSVTLLFSAATCLGQPCNPHPLRPNLLPPCPSIADKLAQAAQAAKDFNENVAALNAKIEGARKRIWKAFPNGADFDAAEMAFLEALAEKDMYYLMLALQEGMSGKVTVHANVMSMLGGNTAPEDLAKFPTNVDRGVSPYARPLFAGWVNALRRAEGRDKDGAMASPLILASAVQDRSNYRKAYERSRNWAEFMSSGLDMSKHLTPQAYMLHQMESDVSWVLEQAKSAQMPDGEAATRDLYNYFVKTFGEKEVLAAATAVLTTPKNSVGGLAQRAEVEIGSYIGSPSPNPYFLFLTLMTRSTPRNYAIAVCLDPYALLGGQAAATFNTKEQWVKAVSLYDQVAAKYGEATTLAAAGRLRAIAKDDKGGPRGDLENKGSRFWFQTLLKDPKAAIPEVPLFKVSSYDPRWLGKIVEVRGTVARVDLAKGQSPPYATIYFQESSGGRFTGFTPNSDMLQQKYGEDFSGLAGKPVEIWGIVNEWREGAGVRILTSNQLKVLNAPIAANFTESRPEWLTAPLPTMVDSPEYLAWKKFPAGTKVTYETRLLSEHQPGTDQYTRARIARTTLTLDSIDEERAVVSSQSTVWSMNGRPSQSAGHPIVYKAKQLPPQSTGAPKATTGEETLVIAGKKVATKWELIPSQRDPLTFTKTWTSDEVPSGLVMKNDQNNRDIGDGKSLRSITQTIYAPVDGVEPELSRPGAPVQPPPVTQPAAPMTTSPPAPSVAPAAAPPQAAPPAPVRPVPAPAQPRINTSGMPPEIARQLEFSQQYSTVMQRAGRAKAALAQYQRQQGSAVPADVRSAADRLDVQMRAVLTAMGSRNISLAEQNMRAVEDTVAVIERFLAK